MRPFKAARMAVILAGPSAAPTVSVSAGMRCGTEDDAGVGGPFDDTALRIEGPGGDFADGAQAHHFEEFLARDEAVDMELGALVDLADADQAQISILGDGAHAGYRGDAQQLFALGFEETKTGSGIG